MRKIDPSFLDRLKKLGAKDISACFSCGNCTAICPLTDQDSSFPRKMIRYALLGLKEEILSSSQLWLCYYCGECSDYCPREADPGALMMALRRFAIRNYSLGKLADLFYSGLSSLITWIFLLALSVAGVLLFKNPSPDMNKVDLFSFIGLDVIHYGGMILGAVVLFFAVVQLVCMYRMLHRDPVGLEASLNSFGQVLLEEVFLQKRFSLCKGKLRYAAHLCLFWGFAGLFLATLLVFGVDFFGFPSQLRYAAKALGIIAGAALVFGSGYYLYKRLEKKESYSKASHHTDWIFLLLLLLTGLTGFLTDLFHLLSLPLPTYIAFAAHLITVFLLLLTAPFTKFAHAIYRPLALWLVRASQLRRSQTQES